MFHQIKLSGKASEPEGQILNCCNHLNSKQFLVVALAIATWKSAKLEFELMSNTLSNGNYALQWCNCHHVRLICNLSSYIVAIFCFNSPCFSSPCWRLPKSKQFRYISSWYTHRYITNIACSMNVWSNRVDQTEPTEDKLLWAFTNIVYIADLFTGHSLFERHFVCSSYLRPPYSPCVKNVFSDRSINQKASTSDFTGRNTL